MPVIHFPIVDIVAVFLSCQPERRGVMRLFGLGWPPPPSSDTAAAARERSVEPTEGPAGPAQGPPRHQASSTGRNHHCDQATVGGDGGHEQTRIEHGPWGGAS